ncbi:MAG: hypothetical protein JWO05_683 [Gemmatimonadetes bacterium]|nr:hypothetical protein [Gemmatimonadota bacterium]
MQLTASNGSTPSRRAPRRRLAAAARVAALLAGVLAASCSADRLSAPAIADGPGASTVEASLPSLTVDPLLTPASAPLPLQFSTYEGSGEVVHPDVVVFPERWNARRFWMALTPYPNSSTDTENPSLFAGAAADAMDVPEGLTNPLARTKVGYLSDPDMVYNASVNELWLYYREVESAKKTHKADHVRLMRSSDGIHWSASARLFSMKGKYVVSPTVSRPTDEDWRLWEVDAGSKGCSAPVTRIMLRRSTDGLGWSEPRETRFRQPGYMPWHLDVQWVPSRHAYFALVAAYRLGRDCMSTDLFLATSLDGVTWTTYSSPILEHGAVAQFASSVYRSTFAFDEGGENMTIWFSGSAPAPATTKGGPTRLRWSAAVATLNVDALIARVSTLRAPVVKNPGPGNKSIVDLNGAP